MEKTADRGEYHWTEKMVSDTPLHMECMFGSLNEMEDNGMATRVCGRNLMWEMYDGSSCATLDTYRLRKLSNVSATHNIAADILLSAEGVITKC